MDSCLYAQQTQTQYSSPLYVQHVYPQQQYPVYGIVPPTWTPSPTPYFETPLVRHTYYFGNYHSRTSVENIQSQNTLGNVHLVFVSFTLIASNVTKEATFNAAICAPSVIDDHLYCSI